MKKQRVDRARGFTWDIDHRETSMTVEGKTVSDKSTVVAYEHEGNGVIRVTSVRFKDHLKSNEPDAIYGLLMRGWECPACGRFVSEEKEVHATCCACEGPRPVYVHAP